METVVYRALLVVVIIMKDSMAENCFPIPSTWKVSLISYEEATVSISWHAKSVFCTDRVIISQATEMEETISPPIKVSKGEAMINLKDKCKLYTIRLAALLPDRNELVYSSSKLVWLPSMLSSISVLSNLAIVYIPMECPTPKMMVTACSSLIKTHCVSKSVSSYTETYLSGLSSCTLYNFSLEIQNNSIWSIQSHTAVNLQLSVTLFLTSGTLSTFFNNDCDIYSSFWTISFCMLRNTGHDDDDASFKDYDSSGSSSEVENTCSSIQLHPDRLETTYKISGLQPCTQYTFTIYTRHMLGDKVKDVKEENMITEITQCPVLVPGQLEDDLFLPSVTLTVSDLESTPSTSHLSSFILTFLVIITTILLLCIIIIVRSGQNRSLENLVFNRKPVRSEVENLL